MCRFFFFPKSTCVFYVVSMLGGRLLNDSVPQRRQEHPFLTGFYPEYVVSELFVLCDSWFYS